MHATLLPAACGPLGAPPEAPPLLSTLRQLVSLEWQVGAGAFNSHCSMDEIYRHCMNIVY